jgi:hypothetical protein
MTKRFTAKQGQYLAFIDHYMKVHRRAPAEADFVEYFRVSPPSAHQMLVTLAKKELISRAPGEARAIRLRIPAEELPPLGEDETSAAAEIQPARRSTRRGQPPVPCRAGDWVTLARLPPWVATLPLDSQRVFEHCVGKTFRVEEIGEDDLLVLDVSPEVDELFGGSFNDLRVEPEYTQRAEPDAGQVARRALAGTWRIIEMDEWDQDAVDLVVRGHFRFDAGSRLGSFAFVAVQGTTDNFYSLRSGRPFVELSWLGDDDGDMKNGRGWAERVEDDGLRGHIFFQQGMDSAFKAVLLKDDDEVLVPRPRRRRRRR